MLTPPRTAPKNIGTVKEGKNVSTAVNKDKNVTDSIVTIVKLKPILIKENM